MKFLVLSVLILFSFSAFGEIPGDEAFSNDEPQVADVAPPSEIPPPAMSDTKAEGERLTKGEMRTVEAAEPSAVKVADRGHKHHKKKSKRTPSSAKKSSKKKKHKKKHKH